MHCPGFAGYLYKPVSCLRAERIMTPTLMMALPPKKIDICTMMLFQGELAAFTEVSLAPSAQQGPLSLPLTAPPPAPSATFQCLDFQLSVILTCAVTFQRFSQCQVLLS